MLKVFVTISVFLTAALSAAASISAESCRQKAADQVVLDLNKNGRLWETKLDRKTGEVTVLVEGGKVWLELADEEVSYCNNWSDRDICVDYKFQDPETRRVEHIVQLEVVKNGCILRNYQNLVGARPWR